MMQYALKNLLVWIVAENAVKTEYVWTGDSNSYKGWELWCYCEDCDVETFHKLVKAQKEK